MVEKQYGSKKEYMGDGVYAELTAAEDIVLTTSNGIEETNRIVLEPDVASRLRRFAGWQTKT